MKQLKAFVGFITKYDLLSLLWAAILAACTVKFFMDKSYLLGANAICITVLFLTIWAKNQELRVLRQQLKDDKKDQQRQSQDEKLPHGESPSWENKLVRALSTEDMDEAAKEYSLFIPSVVYFDLSKGGQELWKKEIRDAFLNGIQWQKARFLDTLWHDASKEKPRFRETIIVKRHGRIVDLKMILEMDKYDMTGWEYCYLSDILPPEKGGD